MTESKQVTSLESDVLIQALNMQMEIMSMERVILESKAKIEAMRPHFEKMKDNLVKTGKYAESDFKVRGT